MGKTNQPRRGSWSRRNKGLVAGAIGLALLVGGGSTFAYWTESVDSTVGEVKAGVLDLTNTTTMAAYDISGDTSTGGTATKLGFRGKNITSILNTSFVAVPHDSIEIDLTNEIKLAGSNMQATLTVTSSEAPTDATVGTVPAGWTLYYWILKGAAIKVGTSATQGAGAAALLTSKDGLSYTIPSEDFSETGVEYSVVIKAFYHGEPREVENAPATVPLDLGDLTIKLAQNDRTTAAVPATP
jgi:alternate signal-mediated exported protein